MVFINLRSFFRPNMTEILLIRHGQSANNAQPEHLRVCDPGLTEMGVRQAQALAEHLKDVSLTRLYCSPFLRALETTRPIADLKKVSVHVRADIFEEGGCYSGYEAVGVRGEPGLGFSALSQRYPDWNIDESIPETGWWGRDYETTSQAIQRADVFAKWLESELDDGGCHAFVIHADFKYLLLRRLLGPTIPTQLSLSLYNTGVTHCRWLGQRWDLVGLNSVEHLSECMMTS